MAGRRRALTRGVGSLVRGGMLTATPRARDGRDAERFDIAVLGAGAAGLAAAIFAALDGRRVLVVERTPFVGGTTALSAGTVWIPGTHLAVEAGLDADVESAARYLDAAVGNQSSRAMRDAFLVHGPKAVATLVDRTETKLRVRPVHPDYLSELEGAVAGGRALEPLPFDGSLLGDDFRLLRPPIPEFTVLGGMMVDRDDVRHLQAIGKSVESTLHGTRRIGRYVWDRLRHPRGTRLVMGNALVARLLHSARKLGVTLRVGVETVAVEPLPGQGWILDLRQDGGTSRVTAACIILATGGFSRHPGMRERMLPKPVPQHSPSAPGHTGALHDMAIALGAYHGESAANPCYWAPVSIRTRSDGSVATFPHFFLDRGKPGIFAVGRNGRRFVNETVSYHQFAEAMYASNQDGGTIPAYLVTDARGLRTYGLGMVRPGGRGIARQVAEGYLVEGATLDELAGKLGIDAAGLTDTVARLNRYAATGVDEDFGRGSTFYQRNNGDAAHGPNPTIGPVGTAPFYALRLFPGDIGSATGLVTNENARVLRRDGTPIHGLYACGNDMQSVMGGAYPGPGITLGPAIAFAYAAANHAASMIETA